MIRAVLFDVDGTLYHQAPLRAAMACELGVVPCVTAGPARARVIWRVLRTFREVRETLRALGRADAPLEHLQYAETADRLRIDIETVRAIADEWIFRRPLRHVGRFRRAGLVAALEALDRAGIRAGVFSDYPAPGKLAALEVGRLMSVHVCATEADVNAFKPHPRGFLVACDRWGLRPDEVAYVGDRTDVDAEGAAAAGMSCVIIGRNRGTRPVGAPFVAIRSMSELIAVLARLRPLPCGPGLSHVLAERWP